MALLGFGVLAVTIGVVLTMPLLRKAVNELTLPLSYADVIRQQAAEKHLDPALIAGGDLRRDQVRAARLGCRRRRPDADHAPDRDVPRPPLGRDHVRSRRSGGPQVNIAYGSYYLRYLLDEYHGSVTLALAAYNGGESNVDRWVADARAHGRKLTVAAIPFPETRAYVSRVLHAQREYRRKYTSQLYG